MTVIDTRRTRASVYLALAGIRANLPAMTRKPPDRKLTFEERARVANLARQEKSTPEERAEAARKAAQGAHSPEALARRILRAWPTLERQRRQAVREILSHAEGLVEP